MSKEIERAGIPTVLVCNLISTAIATGANRIVPSVAITHPFGDPALSDDAEKQLRKQLIRKALDALQADIADQTVF